MWATAEHADQNRLTIDLLVHRFPAPNGLDLGVGLLGAALPIVALLRRRFRAGDPPLDPRVSRVGLALALTWVGCIAFMLAPLPALMLLPTPFAYIQFPWRLLGLAGFLAAAAVTVMTAELGRATRGAIAVARGRRRCWRRRFRRATAGSRPCRSGPPPTSWRSATGRTAGWATPSWGSTCRGARRRTA